MLVAIFPKELSCIEKKHYYDYIFLRLTPCIRVCFFSCETYTQTNTLLVVMCYANVHTHQRSRICTQFWRKATKDPSYIYMYRLGILYIIAARQKRSRTRLIYFVFLILRPISSHKYILRIIFFISSRSSGLF